MWWQDWEKKSFNLELMNVCARFYGDPPNSCWFISVWILSAVNVSSVALQPNISCFRTSYESKKRRRRFKRAAAIESYQPSVKESRSLHPKCVGTHVGSFPERYIDKCLDGVTPHDDSEPWQSGQNQKQMSKFTVRQMEEDQDPRTPREWKRPGIHPKTCVEFFPIPKHTYCTYNVSVCAPRRNMHLSYN